MGMKEWSNRRKRIVGVAVAAVLLYVLYLGATRLWAVVLEMHHL
ncbi:MAG: hypothetical protein OEO79_13145 [Gemmatimonadota bacterium]|nr:hypothetical protein [Gemmatimonadota bacterium]